MVLKKTIQSGGKELLTMNQYELIRTAHRVYGKSISEMARLTGHSRNTVKKALRGEPWGYKEREQQTFSAIGSYLLIIEDGSRETRSSRRSNGIQRGEFLTG